MVELLISVGILAFAVLALSSSTVSSMRLSQTNRESALAQAALRQAIENVQAAEFEQIFALYNDDASDDPGGVTAPGSAFDVPGLDPRPDDPDGRVGQVILPITAGASGPELREDFQDQAMGMPRDLDGSGEVDDQDHSGDYQILPVRVRLEWTGKAGDRVLEVRTIVSPR